METVCLFDLSSTKVLELYTLGISTGWHKDFLLQGTQERMLRSTSLDERRWGERLRSGTSVTTKINRGFQRRAKIQLEKRVTVRFDDWTACCLGCKESVGCRRSKCLGVIVPISGFRVGYELHHADLQLQRFGSRSWRARLFYCKWNANQQSGSKNGAWGRNVH